MIARAFVLWLAAVTTVAAGGCLLPDCPDNFRGVHDGDVIQSTITGPYTGASRQALFATSSGDTSIPPSCGDLGDLPDGAVLTSTATLEEPGDGCAYGVRLVPVGLSTGTLTPSASGGAHLQLPGGCAGTLQISFGSSSPDVSYIDNSAPATWWIVRAFQPQGDATLCFPGTTPPASCIDAFTAIDARVN
jgi:hypothetical protein